MTSDTGHHIRFNAHKDLARDFYKDYGVLTPEQFDEVDWDHVYETLNGVPRMF